jgi:hypothetical protein
MKDRQMGKEAYSGPLEKINDYLWRIPKSYKPGMRVDGLIYASEALMELIRADQAPSSPASSRPAWPCRTSTGATVSVSAASARPIRRKGA